MPLTLPEIKTKKLTKLERKWYKEYLECFNSSDALRRAYPDNTYSYDSIRTIASQAKKSVFAKLSITDKDLMENMGLTDEKFYNKLKDKMDAKDKVILQNFRDKEGNPKVVVVDNHAIQLKATELLLKLTGKLNDVSRVELTGKDGDPIKINILAGIGFIPPKVD